MPKKTKFSFDFIIFFIEKTQICLNLKLTKVICNLQKIQVPVKNITRFNYKIRLLVLVLFLGLIFLHE